MKVAILLASITLFTALSSCDCKKEIAALQKENDSLKTVIGSIKPAAVPHWYVPGYFAEIKKVGDDYTNIMTKQDANKKILAYQRAHFGEQNYSYTLSADSLRKYLAANASIHDLQIFHAMEGVELTVIAVGVDQDGNHIYARDGKGNYVVFEHCQPCPTCNTSYPEANHAEIKGRDKIKNLDTLE